MERYRTDIGQNSGKWPKIGRFSASGRTQNGPERGSDTPPILKSGGPILKSNPPALKSHPPTLKSEQKKAGYFSSPAFNNKSVVMFDNTKIQKVL